MHSVTEDKQLKAATKPFELLHEVYCTMNRKPILEIHSYDDPSIPPTQKETIKKILPSGQKCSEGGRKGSFRPDRQFQPFFFIFRSG